MCLIHEINMDPNEIEIIVTVSSSANWLQCSIQYTQQIPLVLNCVGYVSKAENVNEGGRCRFGGKWGWMDIGQPDRTEVNREQITREEKAQHNSGWKKHKKTQVNLSTRKELYFL